MGTPSRFQRVELRPIPVVVVSEPGDPGRAAPIAFDRLEKMLESLRGRKFYGYWDPRDGEYRACLALRDEDEAARLGLPREVLAGGAYLRARLVGEPPAVYADIGPTFDALEAAAGGARDPTRHFIEFYRERDEIDVFVPVIQTA